MSPSKKSVISLAIWGPPASGKTTLLAMMNACSESYGWNILPAVSETSAYLEATTSYLFDRGELMPPNTVERPFIHRFVAQKRMGLQLREFILEIPDAAGELYVNPEHEMFNMVEYLGGCNGLIWLVDPTALKGRVSYGVGPEKSSYRRMIYRTLSRIFQTRFGSQGRIDKYMAFVLTKMDHPDHVKYFDDPKNYALDLLGRQVEQYIEKFCMIDKVEFFSTSALGFADAERTVSNLDDSDSAHAKLRTLDIEPVGVFDPLNWLLSRLI